MYRFFLFFFFNSTSFFADERNNNNYPKGYCRIPQRYVLTLLAFLALFNAYAMRANIAIAITRMVVKPNKTEANDENGLFPQKSSYCELEFHNETLDSGQDFSALKAMTISEHYNRYSVSIKAQRATFQLNSRYYRQ